MLLLWKKGIMETPYQSSGSESLKGFAPKMSRQAGALSPCLHSPSTPTWTLHACLVQGGDIIEAAFCCMRGAYCGPSTLLDRLFLSFIYLQDFTLQF